MSANTTELRRRKPNATDGQFVVESTGKSDPKQDTPKAVPVALDSNWRCVQVTQLVLVIAVVVLLVYGVVVATDIRRMLKEGLPEDVNATHTPGMPRMDTMVAAFRKRQAAADAGSP